MKFLEICHTVDLNINILLSHPTWPKKMDQFRFGNTVEVSILEVNVMTRQC